jgi:hypothetical protein
MYSVCCIVLENIWKNSYPQGKVNDIRLSLCCKGLHTACEGLRSTRELKIAQAKGSLALVPGPTVMATIHELCIVIHDHPAKLERGPIINLHLRGKTPDGGFLTMGETLTMDINRVQKSSTARGLELLAMRLASSWRACKCFEIENVSAELFSIPRELKQAVSAVFAKYDMNRIHIIL